MDTFFFFLPIENKLFLQFYITPIYTTIGIGKCTFDVVIVSITTKPYILQKILNQ